MRAVVAVLLLLAVPAAAQDQRPRFFPTRDAAVTYRVSSPATAGTDGDVLRIAYLAAERKQRMDTAPGAWTVIERATNVGVRIDDGSRTALRVPLNPAMMAQFEPAEHAALTRGREERIAGTPCTTWAYRSAEGNGRFCVTPEGLPLRMEATIGEQTIRAEATEISLAPQDPARPRAVRLPGEGGRAAAGTHSATLKRRTR
ncbi:hypothetical protein ACE7GA_10230 [Roseomonas sp. CCTCC AB2023176]|uniref:hypothetical protein n=1 Tax=Roseomonas sp. CCTCC AB2023176 TaxID=3342640 RepID=UPI0035E33424